MGGLAIDIQFETSLVSLYYEEVDQNQGCIFYFFFLKIDSIETSW